MISIIIPIYNCEKYLYICLNSILKQSYTDFEVICIDDCSTDSSLEILNYFNQKDSRIKLLKNNEHKGYGFCINKCLNSSSGEHILFINPIDWIDSNALKLLYSKSKELNLDLLIYNTIEYNDSEKKFDYCQDYDINKIQIYENKIFNPITSKSLLLNNLSPAPWNKFYKKSLLNDNDIYFPEKNFFCENEVFNLSILLHAKRISFLDKALYNHRIIQYEKNYFFNEKTLNPIQIAGMMIETCINNKTYEKHKREILNYIFNILSKNYEKIDETQEYNAFKSTQEYSEKYFKKNNIKTDILEYVDENILKKFEQERVLLNEKYKKYLAIDIGGTNIKYTLLDKSAKPKISEMKSKKEEKEFYKLLDEIISPHLNKINGIAISFPGVVDVKKGIVQSGGSYSWIKNLPLKLILEQKYGKTVWIENDGKCSALAEHWKGGLNNTKNGVVIGLGTGIAGGIILNGELYRGINGTAGEFSSIIDNFEDPTKANKLYQIGGYKSLIGRYTKAKGIDSIEMSGREFFEKYHEKDEIAMNVLKDYAKTISTGIINIQSILNVEKFCIGGGISSEYDLIKEIKETVHNYFTKQMSPAIKEPEIERCFFKNGSGCVGALYNFLIMEKSI